jgi:hypothetical protein
MSKKFSRSSPYPEPKKWFPKNPKKYKGDVHNIWVRSSWEQKVLEWFDINPNVLEYSSEEIVIPYISPIDNRPHRYFVDVYAKMKKINGKIEEYLIEIKPYHQTQQPKYKNRITKTYINEVCTWGVNSAKFEAAKKFCRQRGWIFKILTEQELFNT